MVNFGWSLPPGCGTLPGEEDYPCEVCGNDPVYCICPECKECGAAGDPQCYITHGMRRTEEQKFTLEVNLREFKDEIDSEHMLDREYYELPEKRIIT